MNKYKLARHMWVVVTICITCLFFLSQTIAHAEVKEIDIETNAPEKILIRVTNLKPGDWIPRELVVYNKGKRDFNYTTTIENASTEKKLFKQITLVVKKDNQVLYSGLLKDFNKIAARFLAAGTAETIHFTVTVPYELGNEYQGADANFDIKVVAEADNSGGPGPNPDPNPGTPDPNPGTPDPNPGTPDPNPGTPDPNPGTPDPNPGTPDPNPGTPGPNPGTPDPNPGTPDPNPGTPNPEPGISTPETPDSEMNVGPLPNTATNLYNLMLVGGLLVSFGGGTLFLFRRRLFSKFE